MNTNEEIIFSKNLASFTKSFKRCFFKQDIFHVSNSQRPLNFFRMSEKASDALLKNKHLELWVVVLGKEVVIVHELEAKEMGYKSNDETLVAVYDEEGNFEWKVERFLHSNAAPRAGF